ncbi:MAG: metallophosphoesterase [Thermoplasmata archaeon]|nr:metallophosphoesterase [Thermoplasmata archaeon]MCI4356767.1 metallophosphoesterase [Thermoplasmata archaeon]
MRTARVAPVPDSPALLVTPGHGEDRWLIVADLHLGLGEGEQSLPAPPEGSPERLANALRDLAIRTGASRIVIAGDVKHPIVGTPRALRPAIFRFFADLLEAGVAMDVVLGNHDVGLVPHLPREVAVYAAAGMVRDGVGVFHGHRWPSQEVLRAGRLVAGHLHPGYRFASVGESASGKLPCWVRVAYPPLPKGDRPRAFRAEELIVLPAFHPLAGREALNREKPRRGRSFLFRRFLAEGLPRAYLLDGTDVGPIATPPRARPRGSPGRARRRR